jgi:hypothetical protein
MIRTGRNAIGLRYDCVVSRSLSAHRVYTLDDGFPGDGIEIVSPATG